MWNVLKTSAKRAKKIELTRIHRRKFSRHFIFKRRALIHIKWMLFRGNVWTWKRPSIIIASNYTALCNQVWYIRWQETKGIETEEVDAEWGRRLMVKWFFIRQSMIKVYVHYSQSTQINPIKKIMVEHQRRSNWNSIPHKTSFHKTWKLLKNFNLILLTQFIDSWNIWCDKLSNFMGFNRWVWIFNDENSWESTRGKTSEERNKEWKRERLNILCMNWISRISNKPPFDLKSTLFI